MDKLPPSRVPSRPAVSRPPFLNPPIPYNLAVRPDLAPQHPGPPSPRGPGPAPDHRLAQGPRPALERPRQEHRGAVERRQAAAPRGAPRENWRRRRDRPADPRDDDVYSRMVQVVGFPDYTRPQDLVHALSEFGSARVERVAGDAAALVFACSQAAAAAVQASGTLSLYGEFLTVRPYTKDMDNMRRKRVEPDKGKPKGPAVEPNTISWEGDFHCQLDALLKAVRLTQDEIKHLATLYEDLEFVLKTVWPGCVTIPFGSVTTGLGVKASDADCFVRLGGGAAGRGAAVPRARRALAAHPRLFSHIVAIPNANTPIVKFVHIPTRTPCDVSFKTMLGVQNSKLIGFLLHADPRLLPLAVVVKYWASVHELSGTGKLTNYALTMLVVFYLQQLEEPLLPPVAWLQRDPATEFVVDGWNAGFMSERERLPPSANDSSIDDLLGGFFEFYCRFDFSMNMVCPYLGRPVQKNGFRDVNELHSDFERYKTNVTAGVALPLRSNTPMCIQDPFEQCHNVASPVTSRLAAELKEYIKFAAATYEKETPNHCRDFLPTILLDKPKLPRAKVKTQFRVNIHSDALINIFERDWQVAAKEVVDCIFRTVLQLNLEPVKNDDAEETPKIPHANREKIKYTCVLTRAIWKRKQFNKLYSAMRLKLFERESRITSEIMATDNNVIDVPFQLIVTYVDIPRTVIMVARPGAGDLQTFKEFGKFFQAVMQNWFVGLSKVYWDKPVRFQDKPVVENSDKFTDDDSETNSDSDASTEDERSPNAETESAGRDTARTSDSEKTPSDGEKENIEDISNVDINTSAADDRSQTQKLHNDIGHSRKNKANNNGRKFSCHAEPVRAAGETTQSNGKSGETHD